MPPRDRTDTPQDWPGMGGWDNERGQALSTAREANTRATEPAHAHAVGEGSATPEHGMQSEHTRERRVILPVARDNSSSNSRRAATHYHKHNTTLSDRHYKHVVRY